MDGGKVDKFIIFVFIWYAVKSRSRSRSRYMCNLILIFNNMLMIVVHLILWIDHAIEGDQEIEDAAIALVLVIVIVDAAIHDPLIDVDTILHLLDEGSPHFSLIHSFIDYIFCRDYRRNSWRDRRSRSRSPGRYRSSQSFRRRWDTFCVSRVNNMFLK